MFTLAEMAAFFERAAVRCEPELQGMVEVVATRAAILARSYIGHEQEEWAPLSSATVDGFRHEAGFWIVGKEALGYGGAESPLLRTAALRDSVDFEVTGLAGFVGSDSKVALYQEMGTAQARYPVPPRPVFAKAMKEATIEVEALAGEIAIGLLAPK